MVRPLRPSLSQFNLSALSSLSEILYDIIVYNEEPSWMFASREDLGMRARLAHRLETWKRGLDHRLTPGADCMPHISHLKYVIPLTCIASLRSNRCHPLSLKWSLYRRMKIDTNQISSSIFYHLVNIIIFRPLLSRTDLTLPGNLGTQRTLIFGHIIESLDTLWLFRSSWSFQHSSLLGLLGPIMSAFALVPELRYHASMVEPLTRACQAIHEHSRNLAIVPYLLAGLRLLGKQHNVEFSDEVKALLEDPTLAPSTLAESLNDVPIGLLLWIRTQEDDEDDTCNPPLMHFAPLGDLLSHWESAFPDDSMVFQREGSLSS